jgi:hypothetical protein
VNFTPRGAAKPQKKAAIADGCAIHCVKSGNSGPIFGLVASHYNQNSGGRKIPINTMILNNNIVKYR